MTQKYPKRLIEVDLPIRRISANARDEKDSRLGHIPRLHIYPAARPAAACRAVLCASLWPDPVSLSDWIDEQQSSGGDGRSTDSSFLNEAIVQVGRWVKSFIKKSSLETQPHLIALQRSAVNNSDPITLRTFLLDFLADFSKWENSIDQDYLETARALTGAAHLSLGGHSGTHPLVVDLFAGGGAIPLESLRVGAEAYATDLNPLAVLLNRVVLDYVPRFGERLAQAVEEWEEWIETPAREVLGNFYPGTNAHEIPIAYLWARTVLSSAPGEPSPVEIPLLRSMKLTRGRRGGDWALRWERDSDGLIVCDKVNWTLEGGQIVPVRRPRLEVYRQASGDRLAQGTVQRGSVTCPITNYTTPVTEVRSQLLRRRGGTKDARLFCVVCDGGENGRSFRSPTKLDFDGFGKAKSALEASSTNRDSAVNRPLTEPLPPDGTNGFRVQKYGMSEWGDLFNFRQTVSLNTYARLAKEFIRTKWANEGEFAEAVQVVLALIVDRLADLNSSLCGWQLNTPNSAHVFTRWALPMLFDFAEVNPLAGAGGSPASAIRRMAACIRELAVGYTTIGTAAQRTAWDSGLPDDSVSAVVTDPPYYDAIPYSDLLDFFAVWLNRTLPPKFLGMFQDGLNPKGDECVVDVSKGKNHEYFRDAMTRSLAEARRIVTIEGIAVVVFAHKSTSGWEAQLASLIDAGWVVTASWPIDTEMASRMRAMGSAALASSIHLVCRPRATSQPFIGDWRDVLHELPRRIHEWMPRLASEGVVGADAIFACLGPALEVFSRYSRVEKATGEAVALEEYLEHVWAAVAKEALALVFEGADATGFEADARLTAMWLWTLKAPDSNGSAEGGDKDEDTEDEQEDKKPKISGFRLEYDAARKIAQGLGAHLESLTHLVEVSGDQARLLPVAERTKHLFGKDEEEPTRAGGKKRPSAQLNMFAELTEAEDPEVAWKEKTVKRVGETALDRVHQAMILFAAGRGEALKRFVVEDGVGQDGKFWRLAQALSALYPPGTDEKRWVDGVLARKKQFGF
jgi:putative DNA methylase